MLGTPQTSGLQMCSSGSSKHVALKPQHSILSCNSPLVSSLHLFEHICSR